MDERELISKLQNSNHKAYEIIFKQHYAFLCAVAYEYVHDEYICQSIVEDVILALTKANSCNKVHQGIFNESCSESGYRLYTG